MEYQNLGDVATQLRSAGLMLDSVRKTQGGVLAGEVYVESARSVRCDVEGETKKQSGAYWLHELRLPDGIWITGAYWVDHGNSKYKIELRKVCAKCGADMPIGSELCPAAGCGSKKAKAREIPQEQLDAHRKRMAEARRQAEEAAAADAEVAASWANAVWLASREIFSPAEHDYLMRKKLKSAHGARVFESNEGVTLEGAEKRHYEYLSRFHGALVVPMLDKQGRRRGLQFILSRQKHGDLISKQGRDKEYWPRGMLKTGLHYVIGGGMHGIGLVAEGFATAASLAEASNLPVAVAFDAGNVGTVGEQIWLGSKKRIKLLYAADDDWLQHCIVCKKPTPVAVAACRHCGQAHGKGNAGVDKARLAAEATAGAWLAPVFSTERSAERKGPTDFNDLRCLEGEQIVAAQVAGKLEAIEWRLPPSAGGGSGPIRGAGEKQLAMLSPEEVAGRFSPVWSTDDVYYFDHRERVVCAKASLVARMGRHGWDMVLATPEWQAKPEVPMESVDFDPAETDREVVYNLWGGWPEIERKEGATCTALIDLLRHLCSHEIPVAGDLFDWVVKWLAYPLQNVGAKMQTAIVMHGGQGAGKNTFFNNLLELYGREYAVEFGPKQLEKRFNALFSKKMFAVGNEIVASREDLYHVKGQIKHMITEARWVVEAKNKDERWERNCCNFVFMSNELRPAAIDKGDRRHCVIWTPPTPEPSDDDYAGYLMRVKAANLERKNGGAGALYDYLMAVDLTGFDAATWPPMTEAKRALIEDSLDSRERFWGLWRDEQVGDLPCVPCLSEDLYEAYRIWAARVGIGKAVALHSLIAFVRKQAGVTVDQQRYRGKMETEKRMVVRPYSSDPPPDKTVSTWLGDCIEEFSGALSKFREGK